MRAYLSPSLKDGQDESLLHFLYILCQALLLNGRLIFPHVKKIPGVFE